MRWRFVKNLSGSGCFRHAGPLWTHQEARCWWQCRRCGALLLQLEADELASREDGLAHDTSMAAIARTAPSDPSEVSPATAVSPPVANSADIAQDAAASSGRAPAEDLGSAEKESRQATAADDGGSATAPAPAEGRGPSAEPAQPEPPGPQLPEADGAPPAEQLPPIVLRTEPAADSSPAEPALASPAAAVETVPHSQDLRDEEPTDATPEEQSGGACKQS